MKRLFLTAACAALLSACGGGDSKDAPKTYAVEYTVSGLFIGNTASVTYQNSTGGTEQKDITLPGKISFFAVPVGQFLYISAQNKTGAGSVSVAITVDGATWKSATSTAPYGIASASGTCCN